ncbi:MAG: KH domain-containing protein, partial [Candidatus Micrarchaeota archaeon]|nr:KH domain-containing protein [Candidatus Micrarchaeota archaeon]
RHNISNATFYKALDLGRVILVLTKGDVGLLIGKQGIVVSELSSALGKKVRIAQTSGDLKKTVSDIIMPARLLGINRTFRNGVEVSTARISREDLMVLPLDGKTLEIALKSLLGEETKIVFE